MNTSRKLGRFSVGGKVLKDALAGQDESRAAWNSLFGQVIVLEAKRVWETDGVEYLAHCEQFEELDECQMAPRYECTISKHEEMMGAQKVITYVTTFTRSSR